MLFRSIYIYFQWQKPFCKVSGAEIEWKNLVTIYFAKYSKARFCFIRHLGSQEISVVYLPFIEYLLRPSASIGVPLVVMISLSLLEYNTCLKFPWKDTIALHKTGAMERNLVPAAKLENLQVGMVFREIIILPRISLFWSLGFKINCYNVVKMLRYC